MDELKRWRDDPDAPHELKELMGSIPRPESLAMADRAALFSKISSVLGVSSRGASTWLRFAVVSGTLTASGAIVFGIWHSAGAPRPESAVLTAPIAQTKLESVVQSAPATSAPEVLPGMSKAKVVRAPAPRPSAPRLAAPPSEDTLASEARMLEEARRVLVTSPARAVALLELHRKRFPNGQLTPERLYLTVDALARSGNSALARKHAQALIRGYPRSAYARQVEGVIERAQR